MSSVKMVELVVGFVQVHQCPPSVLLPNIKRSDCPGGWTSKETPKWIHAIRGAATAHHSSTKPRYLEGLILQQYDHHMYCV